MKWFDSSREKILQEKLEKKERFQLVQNKVEERKENKVAWQVRHEHAL